MTKTTSIVRLPSSTPPRGALGPRRFATLLLTALTTVFSTGCIVNTSTSGMGTIEVQWATGDCNALGVASVRVRSVAAGFAEVAKGGIACDKGFTTLVVNPGVHTVTIDGFSNGNTLVTQVSISNLFVEANGVTTTPIVGLNGGGVSTGGGKGAVQLSWTIDGQSPQVACAQRSLTKVTASILDSTKSKVLASGSVACSAGGANLVDVPVGTVYLQLDASTADGSIIYGNPTAFGPIQVSPSATMLVQTPIDIVDLRAIISLDWQFSDGGTCGQHNSQSVFIEVSDTATGNKVVVPMNDPWAKKPCNIGPNSSYEARVIDMQFATPTCAIPPGAKGLVICGIQTSAIGVRVSVLDANQNAIFEGGSMTIKDIPAGQHTAITVPLMLSACDSVKNVCGAP